MSRGGEVEREIREMLMPGEEVLLVAEQSRLKPGGSMLTPNKIYVSNRRVFFRNPRMLGLKADMVDVAYEDISNIRMKRGLFSTEIYLKSRFLSDEVRLPAVDKSAAMQVNTLIRKGIGGELPGQVLSREATAPVQPVQKESPVERLEKLSRLKESGAITDEEYQRLKKKILEAI